MKYILFSILVFFAPLIYAKNTATPVNSGPQMQRGQNIYDFLNKNPSIQKNWITADDRKRAYTERMVNKCTKPSIGCSIPTSMDTRTGIGHNRKTIKKGGGKK